jgi:hypothetical protein
MNTLSFLDPAQRHHRGAIGLAVLLGAACSDGSTVSMSPVDDPAAPADPVQPGSEGSELGPLYALHTTVYVTDDTVMSYATLTDTLDITALPQDEAREFPGYSFLSATNGKLLVSDGETPTITSYDIGADHSWQEVAQVNFVNQGLSGLGAGFERHWFLNEDTAYLTLDVTQRVVWSPSEMVIKGVMEDSALVLERDGLQLDATFNRQPRIMKGPVLKPFYYRDQDWFLFGQTTSIAVYDPVTNAEQAIIDVPCPSLEVPSQDEAGNTYFSSWSYGPILGLFGEGPELCVRRIKADSTLDESWAPDLTTWTEGRPVKVFRYMRDGKAVGTVLHVDEVDIDFSAGYSEEAALELDSHWRLWMFDLEAETARPIEGIDGIGSGFFWANFEGRTFLFVPNVDWSQSTVFDLDIEGNATRRFDSTGFINDWIRVR